MFPGKEVLMKPLEILSAIPKWKDATPGQIVGSPAFVLACRLGESPEVLRLGAVEGGDTLDLSVVFGDEPHLLRLSRSPRFKELDAIWDSRADVPEPILLALVEKDCGELFQMLENAVRRQLRLAGLSGAGAESKSEMLFAQVADVTFALTRSDTVVSAFGVLRNLDLSHPVFGEEALPAETEYAAFALSAANLTSLAVGDALLLPEIGSVPPRLVVDGRFAVDEKGVLPYADDGRCRILAAEPRVVALGELFDAAENPRSVEGGVPGQLRLVQNGKTLFNGRLDKIGDQNAFLVESTNH